MKLDWKKTFLIGFGFFGISVVWQVYNTFVPLFLQSGDPLFDAQSKSDILGFGLSATWSGFIMTLDNIAALILLPLVGAWSDRTRTRIGRRYPFILTGAPIAALAFALVPVATGMINPAANGKIVGNGGPFALFIAAIGVFLLAMACFRTPVVAMMPDLTPSPLRSKANGVINFMGGFGGVIAALGLASFFDLNQGIPFWAGVIIMLVAVVVMFVTVREPKMEDLPVEQAGGQKQRLGLRNIALAPAENRKSLILLMLAIFCWFVGYGGIGTFLSSYAVTNLGVSAGTAGMLSSISTGAFILFAIPAGIIGGRFGRKRTIISGLIVFAILLLFARAVPTLAAMYVALGLGGLAWSLVNVNSLPMIVDTTNDARLLGTFTGLYYFASQSADILGPILNGAVIDLTGRNYSNILVVAPIFFVLAILCMLRVTRGEATHAAEGAN
ncbi:MAG: SLC45 family MFS transporter [Chloroflexi bacterium]|mgnify:CR=1 FL=1|nr:SLC45 family MFS transporter [Chloroflexota bacterium]